MHCVSGVKASVEYQRYAGIDQGSVTSLGFGLLICVGRVQGLCTWYKSTFSLDCGSALIQSRSRIKWGP